MKLHFFYKLHLYSLTQHNNNHAELLMDLQVEYILEHIMREVDKLFDLERLHLLQLYRLQFVEVFHNNRNHIQMSDYMKVDFHYCNLFPLFLLYTQQCRDIYQSIAHNYHHCYLHKVSLGTYVLDRKDLFDSTSYFFEYTYFL